MKRDSRNNKHQSSKQMSLLIMLWASVRVAHKYKRISPLKIKRSEKKSLERLKKGIS